MCICGWPKEDRVSEIEGERERSCGRIRAPWPKEGTREREDRATRKGRIVACATEELSWCCSGD